MKRVHRERGAVAALRTASSERTLCVQPDDAAVMHILVMVDDGDVPYLALLRHACPVCGVPSDGICAECRGER